ncbi:uncharacterized protein [Amphiura filiformis]|uniref:uncharacterized protein n=1 Tax=Amphiura filiformis TaxID=82378 RepID=UPI003B214F92
MCTVLPALHSLTGCGITSKIGTKKAALKANPVVHLHGFGATTPLGPSSIQQAEQYLVQVIDAGNKSSNLLQLRAHQFHFSKSASHQRLPPTSKDLEHHFYRHDRAFFNAYATMHVLDKQLNVQTAELDPLDYGYLHENGNVLPSTSWRSLEPCWTNFVITSNTASGVASPKIHTAPVSSAVPSSLTFSDVPVTTQSGSNYRITGLTYDPVDQKVYWVERDADLVTRANLDGSGQEVIGNTVNDPREVCLDIYNRVIYWTVQGSSGSVKTRPMDLSAPATDVPGSNNQGAELRDCVYGPISMNLYLVYGGTGSSGGLVKSIPASGGSPTTLDSGLPEAVSIDVDETGRTGGLRSVFIYHDLLYMNDFDDNANNIYTVARTGNGLGNGDETELTVSYPSAGAGDNNHNVVVVTACLICTACISNVVISADQLSVTWDASTVTCNADVFTITAVPSNIGQCNGVASGSDTKTIDWQNLNSIQLADLDLLPNTDYTITVTSGLIDSVDSSVINAGQSLDVSHTTNAAAPSGTPGLTINAATDNSVTLAITEVPCRSRNGEILSYSYYCSNGVTSTIPMTTPVAIPIVSVTGLSCDIQYTCYVAAVTDIGTGPYAEIVVDGSISTVPTSAPCNVMITEASSSAITFAWEKCVCGTRGGVTQSYTYRLLSNGQIITGETNDLIMAFNIPVCDGDYTFEVAVTTSAGTGPYAQKDFRGDAGLAAEPVIVSYSASFDEVVVVIMANPCVLDEPVVLSYVYRLIRFSNKRQTDIVITGEVEAEEDGLTIIQILNLECDTTYELSIAAKTAVGVGPETIFTFLTEGSPNPFRPGSSLMIRPLSASTAIVSWQESLSICPSTDFVVEYRLLNLEQCEIQILDTSTRISTRESEITLNNLSGGSTYTVSVTGQTSSGVDAVLEETWTTPDSVPQWPPTDIGIVYYNPFDLVLEWSAPPCGTRGGVICYEYELVTVSDLTVFRGTTTVPRIQISPPSGYVNYLFRVATKNSVGFVYSNNINVVPDGLCPDRFCLNGGTCYSDNGESFCRCQPGYSGERCDDENILGLCPDGYCLNGGTCYSDTDNAEIFCRCQPGYSGERCDDENILGLCPDRFCLNGATCYPDTDNAESFCRCQPGYGGDRCELLPEPANNLDDGVIIAISFIASVIGVTATSVCLCAGVYLRRRRRFQQSRPPQIYLPPITFPDPSWQLGYNDIYAQSLQSFPIDMNQFALPEPFYR